ncbi:uncharacterized protein G2W53_009827 [Senna tora]|uniref:Uncharacterized protein n=1 Tax=Senna tora TaxID=362788 RepID=A0A834WYU8_9FABA|nr:uncharacterized protein G2W53_009827 [Senna tora]
MGGAWIISSRIPDEKSRLDLRNLHELRGKRLVAQVSQTHRFANRSGFDASIGVVLAWEERVSCLNIFRTTNRGRISENVTNYEAKDLLRKVVLMLLLESSWRGRSVDHVLTYSGRQIAVGSQKPSRITRQKTCCASESNTSVRVVFENGSGFDAPIGVVLAWEERGSYLHVFPDEKLRSDLRNLHELRGKRLVAQVSQTRRFALYSPTGVKPSGITRQKTCCASESNSSVRIVFANRSGFDALIGVVLAWEECGSCLNIFRTTNRGRISETFTNYEAKDSLRKVVVDAPIGVVLAWEERGLYLNIFWMTNRGRISETFTNYEAKDLLRKKLHELRGKRLVMQVSQTRQFANRSGFDAPIGFVLAWEERGSCLNIFRTTNRGRILETFTNYEGKRLVAQVSQTRRFANRSGFDAPIGVVLAWEECGSCLNIFRTNNQRSDLRNIHELRSKRLVAQVSQTRRSVDHVLTYFGRQIAVGSQKPSRITRQRTCCASESNTSVVLMLRLESSRHGRSVDHVSTYSGRQIAVGSHRPSGITRQKTCCASESNTSVRVVFANASRFDAPIGFVLAWEERGSCLNILGRQIAVGSQKPSQITRQKTCCGSESNTSVRVVFANVSGFDAPIGVVLTWEDRGSCLNIFRMTNHGLILGTFTYYEPKDLLPK